MRNPNIRTEGIAEKEETQVKGTENIANKIIVDFLTLKRAACQGTRTIRDHRCQPKLLYPVKFSVPINGERKTFHNKNKFK